MAPEPINDAADNTVVGRTLRKPSYPISPRLGAYLARFRRELELPVSYERLDGFRDSVPLRNADGQDTLWESVLYPPVGDGRAEGRSQVRVRAAEGARRSLGRRPPVRRPDRLLQLREFAAVPDSDRQQHQREPGLFLRQEGRRLTHLWAGARAPPVAEPAQLRDLRVDAGRGARGGRARATSSSSAGSTTARSSRCASPRSW